MVREKNFSYETNKKILEDKKFFPYEASSFSKKGYQSHYKTSVLEMKSYVGIGPSSHSRVTQKKSYVKFKNTKNLTKWLNPNTNPYREEVLTKVATLEEFLLLGLSRSDGISIEMLEKFTDYQTTKYVNFKNISALKKETYYLRKEADFLNYKGMLKINSILSYILIGG